MPQLLDLPAEVLHNIFKHLPTEDALKAAIVCKCIHQVVTPHIYRIVKLSDGDYCECPECEPIRGDDDDAGVSDYQKTHQPVSEAFRKLTSFCATVSRIPLLARRVRSLEFKTRVDVFRNNTQWAKICNDEILRYLLEKLPLLQQIHIQEGWKDVLLKDRPVLPRLQAAYLSKSPLSDILYFMKQPRLNKIFLFYGDVSISPLQHFSTVSEIFLRGPSLNPDQLQALIKVPKVLKSLFWQRTATHDGHRVGSSIVSGLFRCNSVPAGDIGPVLQCVSDSLERLAIGLGRVSARCTHDRSLIGSLLSFTKLKHLQIEATLAIGIRTCPKWFNDNPVERGVETRSFEDLVTVLPTNLETLWLEMDREQCDRDGTYCLGILDALLAHRKRLASVHSVMLQEINAWYSERMSACLCATFNACYTHKRQQLSDCEKDRIFLEQQKGALMALNVYYLAERLCRKERNTSGDYRNYDITYTRTLLELGHESRSEV